MHLVKPPRWILTIFWTVCVLLLWAAGFGATILGVPTVYSWWKHCECWLRGPDSYACWELDLLKQPQRPASPPPFKNSLVRSLRYFDSGQRLAFQRKARYHVIRNNAELDGIELVPLGPCGSEKVDSE